MVHSIRASKRNLTYSVIALTISCAAFLASCAIRFPTDPTPSAPQNSITLDEFFTPAPNGNADDYYLLLPGEDDIDFSYFIDEQDYFFALDHPSDPHYIFAHNLIRGGHGYGDANHIHEFVRGPHHHHGPYIAIRHTDWTDSLALTDTEKIQIEQAMTAFLQCAAASINSFKVASDTPRAYFRQSRIAIIVGLDSGLYPRDSARTLLDSAIVKYEAETDSLRTKFVADLATCRVALDADIKNNILTPVQYAIWLRHRGW